MELKHGDFWGHVLAVMTEAHEECARMFMSGNPDEFEKIWLDPKNGKVALFSRQSWFTYAEPIPRKIASESFQYVVKGSFARARGSATNVRSGAW